MAFRQGDRQTVYRFPTIRNAYVVFQSATLHARESGYIAYCAGKIGTFNSSIDAQVAVIEAVAQARREDRVHNFLVVKAKKA